MSQHGAGSRRGRRRGAPDTRAAILAAARARFAEVGHAGASMRSIAAAAGVDPALLHHYFGSKDDLFVAALPLPVDPRTLVEEVVAGGRDGAAERLVRAFVTVWEDPDSRASLLALLRGTFEPAGRRLVGRGLVPALLLPVGTGLGVDEPERRMSLVISQLIGVAVTRYLVGLDEIVALSAEEVVATYTPVVHRYLFDDLPTG